MLEEKDLTSCLSLQPSLPCYAPPATLPAKLPTKSEIDESTTILTDRFGTKVVALAPHYIVKYGEAVDLEEGRTMIFIQKHIKIPVPQVYALYQEDATKYIIMEHIDGQSLETVWPDLSEGKKIHVIGQIKEYVQSLRAIPSPNAYGSLNGQPLRSNLFWMGAERAYKGPFGDESELINFLLQKYRVSPSLKGKASFYEKWLPLIFHDNPPVLTHGDLQQKNIMVKPNEVVVMLDWESAGWYPSWYEYASAIEGCRRFGTDWHSWIEKAMDPCPVEHFVCTTLQNEIGW